MPKLDCICMYWQNHSRDFAQAAEPRIFILILSHILYREMKELLPAIARLGPGIRRTCYLSSCWKDGTLLPSWQGQKAHERTASWNLVETITLNILKRIIISYDCVWEIISKLTFAACLLWGCLGVDLQIEQFVLCFQNCTLHWKYWVWVWFFKRTLWITACASHGTMPSHGWEKDRIGRYHELFAAVECGHSFHSFRVSWQPWSSESAVPFSDILEIKLQVFSLNCVFSRFDHEGSLSLTGWLAYYHLGPCMHPSGR